MSQQIAPQHPAVVLRSHYTHMRMLLAAALVAVVGLAAAVVIVARDNGQSSSVSSVAPANLSVSTQQAAREASGIRFDGGPEEGTRGVHSTSITQSSPVALPPGTRFDGGPEEGTRGARSTSTPSASGTRFDGGPEEGTRGAGH